MINISQINGAIKYLTKLIHTVGAFRFKFDNVEYKSNPSNGKIIIEYDVYVESNQKDVVWLWDYLSCKSKHIVEDACGVVSVSFGDILPVIKHIYVDGFDAGRYGGYIPESFVEKISEGFQNNIPKQIKSYFYCGGTRKEIVLIVNYEVSNIYIDDGLTTDVSVYCSVVLVDNKPLENITQDLAETIVGYLSEDESVTNTLDNVVWGEIARYMDGLDECELWTHTYAYIRNIGDIDIEDFNYVSHSTFSSKLCDFITGDY